MVLSGRRTLALAALLVVGLSLGLAAERVWVANRGGSTVNLFDSNGPGYAEEAGSPITVGSGPVDIASDQPDSVGPVRLFVTNAGSHDVSIIDVGTKTAFGTIFGGPAFGAFDTPSGVTRAVGPTISNSMVVVDRKLTSGLGGNGRGTIRFIDPWIGNVVDEFRDASPDARYSDVVFTSNGRLWIADEAASTINGGVVVVRFPGSLYGPPFTMQKTLVYTGYGEYADFIYDTAATPTYLLKPRRLATNGTTRVVVADGGSNLVSILDAGYIGDDESTALIANVPLPPGTLANDVAVIGDFAYVTSNAAAPASNFFRIDLSPPHAMTALSLGAPGETVAGIGRTADGLKLFVGAGSAFFSSIHDVDAATFTFTATIPAFGVPGSFPFAFYSSNINTNLPSTPTGGSGSGGGSNHGDCGLLGLEAALVLLALRRLRKPRV